MHDLPGGRQVIDILTLFPEFFQGPLNSSITKIAQDKKLVSINLINWRMFATDKHGTVDDRPYGGGQGMVIKVDIIDQALENLKKNHPGKKPFIILLTPQGKVLQQKIAANLAQKSWLVFICGHYEGFDERIRDLVDMELSVGDFVLSGGESAAVVVTDAIIRLVPQVLGNEQSNKDESFSSGFLEYPQYTRPEIYQGKKVPEILLSGDHEKIKKWRENEKRKRTLKRRPDLSDQK